MGVARLTYVACWKVVWKQEIQEEVWTQLASNCYTLDLPVDKSSGADFVIQPMGLDFFFYLTMKLCPLQVLSMGHHQVKTNTLGSCVIFQFSINVIWNLHIYCER